MALLLTTMLCLQTLAASLSAVSDPNDPFVSKVLSAFFSTSKCNSL